MCLSPATGADVGSPRIGPLTPGLAGGTGMRSPGTGQPGFLSPFSPLTSFANNETVKAKRIQTIRRTFHSRSSLLCLRPLAWSRT